jgi:hypothetical protein
MSELDKIPQKQTVEIETIKLDEPTLKTLVDLNSNISSIVTKFGEIYVRRNELNQELKKLDELQIELDSEFKSKNAELVEFVDNLDDKYPQARINLQEGLIQFQPGAPTRKQQRLQATQPSSQEVKAVN